MTAAQGQASIQPVLRRLVASIVQAARQRTQGRRADVMRLSSRGLAKGASVHVLRWDGEELLVGCTDQSMVVLARRQVAVRQGDPA